MRTDLWFCGLFGLFVIIKSLISLTADSNFPYCYIQVNKNTTQILSVCLDVAVQLQSRCLHLIGFNAYTMLNASLLRVQYACLLLKGHGHYRGPHISVSHQLPLLAVSLDLELHCHMLKYA